MRPGFCHVLDEFTHVGSFVTQNHPESAPVGIALEIEVASVCPSSQDVRAPVLGLPELGLQTPGCFLLSPED